MPQTLVVGKTLLLAVSGGFNGIPIIKGPSTMSNIGSNLAQIS